jgi:U3 small nucleolar RNA-associated protein 11
MPLVRPLTDGVELDNAELDLLKETGVISSSNARPKHIVFVENDDQGHSFPLLPIRRLKYDTAKEYVQNKSSGDVLLDDTTESVQSDTDLGWKQPDGKKKRKMHPPSLEQSLDAIDEESTDQRRRRLLKELSARLARDQQLRYAEREFEMQRLLMGKGRRQKVRSEEMVQNDAEDEDEIDARKGRTGKGSSNLVNEKTWKPRVYRWKTERKR